MRIPVSPTFYPPPSKPPTGIFAAKNTGVRFGADEKKPDTPKPATPAATEKPATAEAKPVTPTQAAPKPDAAKPDETTLFGCVGSAATMAFGWATSLVIIPWVLINTPMAVSMGIVAGLAVLLPIVSNTIKPIFENNKLTNVKAVVGNANKILRPIGQYTLKTPLKWVPQFMLDWAMLPAKWSFFKQLGEQLGLTSDKKKIYRNLVKKRHSLAKLIPRLLENPALQKLFSQIPTSTWGKVRYYGMLAAMLGFMAIEKTLLHRIPFLGKPLAAMMNSKYLSNFKVMVTELFETLVKSAAPAA